MDTYRTINFYTIWIRNGYIFRVNNLYACIYRLWYMYRYKRLYRIMIIPGLIFLILLLPVSEGA